MRKRRLPWLSVLDRTRFSLPFSLQVKCSNESSKCTWQGATSVQSLSARYERLSEAKVETGQGAPSQLSYINQQPSNGENCCCLYDIFILQSILVEKNTHVDEIFLEGFWKIQMRQERFFQVSFSAKGIGLS